MEYFPSSVDTSLDLTIGVNRMLVGDEQATTSAIVEELNRVSAENKKLTEMLSEMCENYNTLKNKLMEYVNHNKNNAAGERETSPSKKRKSPARSGHDEGNTMAVWENSWVDQEEPCKKPREQTVLKEKVSRVYYKTEASDTTLTVKDGYQWRKYGQKVTRDNPSPRAYFRCACAPSCLVKKKVQRSIEDQSVLVATYEGEHNHPMHAKMEANHSSKRYVSMASSPSPVYWPKISIESNSIDHSRSMKSISRIDLPQVEKLLVEQMASSLTKDANFTAALAAAVSGRLHHQNPTDSL